MHGAAIFFIILLVLIVASYGGWVLWSRSQASKLGLPPPSLNPIAAFRNRGSSSLGAIPAPRAGGVVGWFNDKVRAMKNKRYASGAYESSGPRGAHRAPLDPDEAWDSRVGNEAYYEEQELGLHQPTAYAGGMPGQEDFSGHGERGRSRTRELDERYDEEMGRGGKTNPFGDHNAERPATNPFGDNNAVRSDLRGVSPRPVEDGRKPHVKTGDSPTERRSLFREDV